METHNERLPDPREIEKELAEFLSKKFGGEVRVISPFSIPQELREEQPPEPPPEEKKQIVFDLKPEELIAYLDQYIIRQDEAKAILATKICTHFNRVKLAENSEDDIRDMVGMIKNNILMIGPTGVGKTYMVKLIAKKIGVPFVKGDATKFSETGYVGGDVEDLVRDLVTEAGGDINLAQYGIIYLDEIDKIASTGRIIGADVSRTGVQRALLKPMEETEVELKVPHDPISIMQEIERFRKTGQRDKRTVSTRNILFIMSGAFGGLSEIIDKRISSQSIGFGSRIKESKSESDLLRQVKSEDLVEFGFETEFVGRLPVRSVLEPLSEDDLLEILRNPNNPVILGKKLDFAAYGISIRFEDKLLRAVAKQAFGENTGARGLVSAVERALLIFEKRLPSTDVEKFPATLSIVESPEKMLEYYTNPENREKVGEIFESLTIEEKTFIREYITENKKIFSEKYGLSLTPSRIELASDFYGRQITDVGRVMEKIKSYCDDIKKMELDFFKSHHINIVMEDDATDYMIEQTICNNIPPEQLYKKLNSDFEFGLKLVREKTGKNRFFLTRSALMAPESYIGTLIKEALSQPRQKEEL